MTAKEEIFVRITKANVPSEVDRDIAKLTNRPRSQSEVVDQFAEYAADYKADVIRVATSELNQAIQSLLTLRASRRVAIPVDLAPEWMDADGVEFVFDHDLNYEELDRCQSVITGCAVAIAETGTIVLDAGRGQGRRAITLIPDHHVCVVFENQVVDSVSDAVRTLEAAVRRGQPLTWISGPSATSDIELSRVEGVHGPRKLDIILVSASRQR